ncbi:MAG: SH3 domain-containing protein [Lachnospiraceae bacterium]|nr:SH3 domain-containing protein [Lachnospiraceae bacterium]
MKTKNKMHAMAALVLTLVLTAVSTLGSVQYVFARTIEFNISTGVVGADKGTTKVKKDTVTKSGSVAGISYDKLVMANVEEAVNVRSEASEKSSLIGKFYKECGGEIIERKSGWTKLKTGSLTGWVKDTYLLFGDEAVKLAESVVEKTAVSKTSALRVRKGKSTDSEILSLLAEGDKIEAIAEEGEWVQVSFSDGETGYVKAEYVRIEDSLDNGETIEQIKERDDAVKKDKEEADKAAAESSKKDSSKQTPAASATNNGAIAGDVNDTLLLAALIQAESGYEPYAGQVSVGTVVMNRLRTGKYGPSLYNVIYAKGQFGPAGSGQVAKIYAQGPKPQCVQAAQEAMSGVSYIGTATHFRNVKSGMPGIAIGNHVFW